MAAAEQTSLWPWDDLPVTRVEPDPKLPASLQRLLGEGYPGQALQPLMEQLGGRQIRVPLEASAECELAQVLGLQAAQVVVRVFGGLNAWDVPRGHRALTAARHQAIRRDYDRLCAEGCRNRMAVLVATYRPITTRQIRTILGREE
jgi:hypothetical protein